MKYNCPQCGEPTNTLSEGYCEDCRGDNQQDLNRHNHEYDAWQRIDADERDRAINRAVEIVEE